MSHIHRFGKWKKWTNPFPKCFQSITNEVRACSCGVIQFRYKPEGNEYRPEWTKEQRESMDLI